MVRNRKKGRQLRGTGPGCGLKSGRAGRESASWPRSVASQGFFPPGQQGFRVAAQICQDPRQADIRGLPGRAIQGRTETARQLQTCKPRKIMLCQTQQNRIQVMTLSQAQDKTSFARRPALKPEDLRQPGCRPSRCVLQPLPRFTGNHRRNHFLRPAGGGLFHSGLPLPAPGPRGAGANDQNPVRLGRISLPAFWQRIPARADVRGRCLGPARRSASLGRLRSGRNGRAPVQGCFRGLPPGNRRQRLDP